VKVIYFAEAKDELDAAIAFYDGKRDDLGDEFYAEVPSAVERIKAFPWSIVAKNSRLCQTHRFPYGLVYQVRKRVIYIIAVMHLHRRPGYWKKRLK
jgi:hypothetical protein